MKKKTKLSKRSIALLAAALLLIAGGAGSATRAALTYRSASYEAEFYMNHLQVHLLENGNDVCGETKNTLDGESKVTGQLATSLGYSNGEGGEKLGKAEPGRVYKEEIAARNGQDIDEYVRLTVRKFWVKTDASGKVIRDQNGIPEKDTTLSPDLIRLTYGKNNAADKAYNQYNKEAWQINMAETTEESATYYYNTALAPEADSALLFDRVTIDGAVAKAGGVKETQEGAYRVFTYEYDYNGKAFMIEADVQAIQTHNADDAIRSQWGIENVTAADGVLSVSN